jgi:hypothetical protein
MKFLIFGYRMYTFSNPKQMFLIFFLPRFLAAIQDTLPEDNNGENTLTNNQILYPICIKCLEKFENDSEQINNKHFAEICLLIVSFPNERRRSIIFIFLARNVCG